MREFEEYGELISKGGTFREHMEHRLLTDKTDIMYLRDIISQKPDRMGEAPVSYYDVEDGGFYSADYSSSKSRVVELIVSEDKETAVLVLIEV